MKIEKENDRGEWRGEGSNFQGQKRKESGLLMKLDWLIFEVLWVKSHWWVLKQKLISPRLKFKGLNLATKRIVWLASSHTF